MPAPAGSLCHQSQRFLTTLVTQAFRLATAASDEANGTVDVFKLEQTIDAKALPQQEIPDEVYR